MEGRNMQIQNVRFIIAAIVTFSAFSCYVSRVNLSIAIIAMVEDNHHAEHNQATTKAAISHLNSSKLLIEASLSSPASDSNHPLPPLPSPPPSSPVAHETNNDGNSSTSRLGPSPFVDQTTGSPDLGEANATTAPPPPPPPTTTTKLQQQLRDPVLTSYPTSKKSLQVPMIWQEKFLWDQVEQGQILGAFFYGYILFQVPGARMAESVGSKWIIMAASASSAVISLIFPLSTQLNSIYLLMALRFVMGLCQSGFFPAAYVLSCRWFPERERAILLTIMFTGGNIGSISTYIMSSYLISSSYGWPSVFYVSGGICSICSLLWLVFGSSVPSENWLITEEEKHFIEFNVNMQNCKNKSHNKTITMAQENGFEARRKSTHDHGDNDQVDVVIAGGDCNERNRNGDKRIGSLEKKLFVGQAAAAANGRQTRASGGDPSAKETGAQPPATGDTSQAAPEPDWFKLVASIPVWTLIFSMYGNEWSQAVICYELPTYLNTALNIPIEQNGFLNSFLQLTYSLASPIMSALGAYVLATSWLGMRKVHVRKLFQSLATFGQMICFVSVPFCGPNRGLIIMFMFSAVIFKACAYSGDIQVPGDLSPDYSGTIFAFCNSIGNTAGFFVPTLTGILVSNAYQREQWAPFWYTSAIIMACSGIIFILFGETRRQDFSKDGAGGCIELQETLSDNKLMMNDNLNGQKENGNDNGSSNKSALSITGNTCCK